MYMQDEELEREQKNRRSSKIPMALKNAFLTTFTEEKLSIKKVGGHLNLGCHTFWYQLFDGQGHHKGKPEIHSR